MIPKIPFVEGQSGTSYFWLRERVPGVQWTHMDPIDADPQIFWNRYVDYLLATNKQFPQHISYRADSSKCKYKWQSGLILDSDITFTIDLSTLQRLTDCGECDDPLECEKCREMKRKVADNYNRAPNKRVFINKFLQNHPYEPSPVEVITLMSMIKELQNIIKTYFQLPTTNEDMIKQLLEPIIMLKYNAIPINDDNAGSDNGFLYRFGYHIYFFNIKCDGQAKYFISRQQFSSQLLQRISQVWPQSTPSQVFDVQPLKGSTALPLSGPEEKRYTRALFIDFNNNNDYEIIDDVLTPAMRNQYLQYLNPFMGEQIALKAQYIQVKTTTASIVDYFEQKHYLSYLQAIKFTKIDDRIAVFKNNQSLNQMMSTYGHPAYGERFSIVSYLYQYLKDKMGATMLHDSVVLATKLIFFVILATKEDIEAAVNLQELHESNKNWMLLNKDRNRYPIKVDSFVDGVIKSVLEKINSQKQQHIRTSEELWMLMFDIFNKFKQYSGQEDDCINTAPESSYSFSDFIDHIQTDKIYQNVYGGDKYLYRLVQRHSAEVTQLISNYIYMKMKQQLYVDGNDAGTLYMFESKETNQTDYNKYHIVSQQLVNALNSIAFEQLAAGVYAGMSIAEKEGRQQYVQIQKKGTEEFIELNYYTAYITGKQVDDEDFAVYKQRMTMFSDLLQIISKNKLQYEKGTIFTERLIGGKIREYQIMGSKAPVIDQEVNIVGVYNGLVQYLPPTADSSYGPRIKFIYGDPCKQHYVSRSMLCTIRPEFLDQDDCLVTPDKLPVELKKIYDDIYNVGRGIYGKGKDINILQWKIYQIVARMFQKTYVADKLFIAYGTGSDGKTTFMQAICNVLGTAGFKKTIDQETRVISSNGYSSIAKNSVLQTADKSASSHDSGGLSELCGNFFQLCSELQSTTPLCVSTIKQLLCGTQIVSRQAFAAKVKSFQNTCFMELQSNYYPCFDQAFDIGMIRRILFYKHTVKFVSQENFDKMDEEEKMYCMVADPTIQQRFFNRWDYIDMMGYFIFTQFLQYQHRDINYIPSQLTSNTAGFFDTQCKHLNECIELIDHKAGKVVAWVAFEVNVREVLRSYSKGQKLLESDVESHLERLREHYKQYIYAYNKRKNTLHRVSDNDFREQSTNNEVIIILADHWIKDQSFRAKSETALSHINHKIFDKCVAKARDIRVKLMKKLEDELPHDTIPEESVNKTIIAKETIIEDPEEVEGIEEIEVSETQSVTPDLPEIPDDDKENDEGAEENDEGAEENNKGAEENNEGAEENNEGAEEVYEEVYEEVEEVEEDQEN